MKYHHLLFMLLWAITACQPASPTSDQHPLSALFKDNAEIDHALDSLIEKEYIPFVYARVESFDGQTLYEHSAVNKELYPELDVNKDSWFRIWSMSKIVTISVTMDLVEDGIISLDEPVDKYIPEFENMMVALASDGKSYLDFAWDDTLGMCPLKRVEMEGEMTIADLIHHKAGFFYPWTNIDCLNAYWRHQDLNSAKNSQALMNKLSVIPLIQHPGTEYYYGLNTTVLGLVAERATGKSLKQLVEERITEPMNIQGLQYTKPEGTALLPRTIGKDSLVNLTPEMEEEVFGAQLPDYDPDHPLYLGGEGMLATTDGYADFARMLLHKGELNGYRFLEEATIDEISSPHTQKDSPWGYNGYNLWVTGDTLQQMGTGEAGLWVGGGYEGTYFWIDHKRQFVAFAMTQMFRMKTAPSDVFRTAVYQELWKHEE